MTDKARGPRKASATRTRGATPHVGQQVGSWKLAKYLAGGGNGQVWEVTSSRAGDFVMKILKTSGRPDAAYRLDRFADEIKFLQDNHDVRGVLPLVDAHVSTTPRELSWYVMPKAVPLKVALGSDPAPEVVLDALATFAETLADLADRGIGHRDIKPDNLFQLHGEWVIGDFGLVTYPEKDPRTEHGRRLGPIDYMAPEMREDADAAEHESADVWALAKTSWVLLAHASLPQPGPHRPADEAFALRERIDYRYADALDRLLERATHMDPAKRISLRDFAKELRACLAAPPETNPDADLAVLQDRVHTLFAPHQRQKADAQERRVQANNAFYELEAVQKAAWNQLAHLTGLSGPMGYQQAPEANQMLGLPPATAYAGYAAGGALHSPDSDGRIRITLEVAMRIQAESSPAEIAAVISVGHFFHHRMRTDRVWGAIYKVPVGSAQFANAVQEITAGFSNSFPEVLRRVARIMDRPEDEEPEWWRDATTSL